ncbi:MAG: ubiquinone/menaquinone biosynthesis C-methylase UbiE [Bacteroidia bacterium]|jgi:ubiquinone/menaquinone biosynthesis C-methylase UbiE
MNLEQKYYESDAFWRNGMLEDSSNKQRILRTIEIIPKDIKSLLDVGCGNGVFVNLLSTETRISVTGTDRSETALSYVKTNKFQSDITTLSDANQKTYDIVTCLEVLEHIPSNVYEKALQELTLASEKYLLISVPFNEKIECNMVNCPKCLSQFNADLHFRKYTSTEINTLFGDEFKLISSENIVKRRVGFLFNFVNRIKHLFRNKTQFNSPVCVVCGFENTNFQHDELKLESTNDNKLSFKTRVIQLIDKALPKINIPGYWVIALYERK